MKTYKGSSANGMREVTVNQKSLSFAMHPEQASPAGFSWGDQSPGSLNLAYSLLLDAIDEDAAVLWSRNFLGSQVSEWKSDWTRTDADIQKFCEVIVSTQSSIPPDERTNAGSSPMTMSRAENNLSTIVARSTVAGSTQKQEQRKN